MARLLRLIVTLAMGVTTQVCASASFQSCPRSLASVLETPPCTAHRLQLATTSRTVMAPTGDASANVCVDALLSLFTTAASLPCSTIFTPLSLERRLGEYIHYRGPGSSEGKFRCKFDSAAPLNVANLSQEFIVDCSEIKKPYDYTWLYWGLGLCGGVFAGLWIARGCWEFNDWRLRRRPESAYGAGTAEAVPVLATANAKN